MDQVRQHKLLNVKENHFTDSIKKQMLMNVIHPLKSLARIADDENQSVICGNPPLTFEQYSDLLQAAATLLDSQEKHKNPPTRNRRSVYYHDLHEEC